MRRAAHLGCLVLLLAVAAASAETPPQLLAQGRADEAIAALKSRTTANPNDAEAWNLLSRAYYRVGLWDPAIEAGKRAVALQPNNAEYHLWLGRQWGLKAENVSFLRAAGAAGNVRREFERAVELDPNHVQARSDLAEFYMEAPGIMGGGKDKARAQVAELEKRDQAAAHWLRARLAEKDNDLAAAEREHRAALQASASAPARWMDLAAFYFRAKRFKEMDDAVAKALAPPKKPAHLYVDAASLLFQSGRDFPRAAQYLRSYLASSDKTEDYPAFTAHHLLGQILEKQGQRDAARGEHEAALKLASEYKPAREALKKLAR